MRNLIFILLVFGLNYGVKAQEIIEVKPVYLVKNYRIFEKNVDVTDSLNEEKRQEIFDSYEAENKLKIMKEQAFIAEQLAIQKAKEASELAKEHKKELMKNDKELKKIEKEQKQKEKEQNNYENELEKREKALVNKEKELAQREKEIVKQEKVKEKALKKKEKTQKVYDNSSEKLKSTQNKYEKLKIKGKLSPIDEAKWLKKIEGLTKDLKKTELKLLKG